MARLCWSLAAFLSVASFVGANSAEPIAHDVDEVIGAVKKLEAEVGEIESERNVETRKKRRMDLGKYDNVVYRALPEEIEKLKKIFRSEESSVTTASKDTRAAEPKTSRSEGPRTSQKSRQAIAAHLNRKIAAKGKPMDWRPTQCGAKLSASSQGLRRSAKAAKIFQAPALLQVAEDPNAPRPGDGAVQVTADNGRSVMGNVAGVDPFVTVYKDGFWSVGCITDSSWKVGDKFGDNKDAYKWGKTTNVSVALYEELVLEESQKKMAPKVCFEFCRSVPGMSFFGIVGGNTCYCTPYFTRVAGGGDKCSMMCPGSPNEICGGKKKSNIFEMHSCGDRGAMLAKRAVESGDALTRFYAAALFAQKLSAKMQDSGAKLKEVAGLGGDSVSSGLGMEASIYAGDIKKSVTGDCVDHYNTLLTAYEETEAISLLDMKQAINLAKADDALEVMDAKTAPVDNCAADVEAAVKLGHPVYDDVIAADSEQAMQDSEEKYGTTLMQYFPIMYVLKNKDKPMQSACEGTAIAKPVGGSMAECAQACDELVHPVKCMAFNYYDVGGSPVCFLMKDLKAATTYNCDLQDKGNEEFSSLMQLSSLRGRSQGDKVTSQHCKTVKALVMFSGMTCGSIFGEGSSIPDTCKDECAKESAMESTATCLVKLSAISTGAPNMKIDEKKRCFGGRDAKDTKSPETSSPFLLPVDDNGVVLAGDVDFQGRSVLEPVIWASGEDDV